MVLKSYTSSTTQSSSTKTDRGSSSRSRPSGKYSSSSGVDSTSYPRSSSATYQSSTSHESYTPKVRSRSTYGSNTYDTDYKTSSYTSYSSKSTPKRPASTYTPGSYTSKRSRTSASAYDQTSKYSTQIGTDQTRYSQDDNVYKPRYTSYSTSTATIPPPRRRYSVSVDRNVNSDPIFASRYGRSASVDPSGESYVLGYASVKTRSDPEEPIPHARINAPEIGHARVHITTETTTKAPEPLISHVPSAVISSSYKPPSVTPSYKPPSISSSYQPPSYQPTPISSSYQPPSYQPPSYQPPSYQPPPTPVRSSIPTKPLPRRDYDFSYDTYGFELGQGHERLDVEGLDTESTRGRARTRRSSISRHFEPEGSRVRSRATSLSRFSRSELDDEVSTALPRRRSASISRYHGVDHELGLSVANYARSGVSQRQHVLGDLNASRGSDLSHMVVQPGGTFNPDQISMTIMPSGQKAVTYEHVSQRGKGDQKEANVRIEEIIHRTRHLQESMHTLEDFVKRNRSLFPEETLIYQHIEFYQLNEAQLKKIGAKPDAVVYGIKLKERLVVPYGSDVTHLLKKYYHGSKSDYEVMYSDKDKIRQGMVQQKDDGLSMKDRIRKQVEEEFEVERQKRLLGVGQRPEVKEASRQFDQHNQYKHMHPHVTDDFLRSFYVNAGLDYDSIYSHRSVGSAAPSDQESTITKSSLASSRKKRLDAQLQFMSKLRAKKASEGQTIRFNCSVQGLPMPDVLWLRGNHIIEDGGKYRISNNYGLLSLEISNLTKEDQGLYTVKATNLEGEIACSAPLEVQEIHPDQEKLGVMTKPYFLVDMQNVVSEAGQRAVFEAQATGKPMPSFRWQKEGLNISQDEKHKVFSDERGNSKLIIKNTIITDMGLYFCIAENREGKAKAAASLRVVDKGQLVDGERPTAMRRRSLSREATPVFDRQAFNAAPLVGSGTKPYFIQVPPSEMSAVSGDPLMMRCIVDGDPKPVVKWYKGARELNYTSRHRVLVEGDHHIMQIRAMLQTDPGEYAIVAENSVGRVKTNVWLNVTPRPEGEDEDFEARREFDYPEFDQYELDITREQGKMAPRFVKKLPLEQEVKEGESLQIGCKIDEVQLPEYVVGVELKVKTKKPEDDVSNKEAENVPEVESTPADVEEIAASVAQSVVSTAVAEATATPSKGSAPKISTSLSDKSVTVGGVIKLTTVICEASPSATVKWSKDGKDITGDDQFEIYAEEDSYNLELIDVELTHSGVYSMTASNDFGSVSSECTITVQESKVAAPSDVKPEEATEAKIEIAITEENKEVEVEATASAEVTIESATETPVDIVEEVKEDTEASFEITVADGEKEEISAEVQSPIHIEVTPAEVIPDESEVDAGTVAEVENVQTETITAESVDETSVEITLDTEETKQEIVEVVEQTTEAVDEASVEITLDTETTKQETIEVVEETTEAVIAMEAVEDVEEAVIEAPVEKPAEKSPVEEDITSEQVPIVETPAPEEAVQEPAQEEKKKKKKKKKDEEVSGDSHVEEKVVETEKKKKKKKEKEEKSEEDISIQEESKKKKKKDEKTEEEVSATEEVTKESKKKKKKKDKVEEPSEDDISKEEGIKEKKKKKKSKEEAGDSGDKSTDESSKEDKKKKKLKKDKTVAGDAAVQEEIIGVETATSVECSQVTVSVEDSTEVSAESTTRDEVGAGDFVVEAEETVSMQLEAEETVSMQLEAEETVSMQLEAEETVSMQLEAEETVSMQLEAEETVSMQLENEAEAGATELTLSVSEMEGESITLDAGDTDIQFEAEETVEMTMETFTMDSYMADESEIGKGDAAPIDDSCIETLVIGGAGEEQALETISRTCVDDSTGIEVRTITQTTVMEMVEGEDTSADFTLEASAAPVMETPLRGCVATVGETARIECKINCEEELQITWTKDGATLSDTELLKLSAEAGGIFALIISRAQKSDEGDYTITASSSGGTIQLTSNIIISEDFEEEDSEEEDSESEGSEIGQGDNVPTTDVQERIILSGDSKSGATETITTSVDGDTVVEVRTVTQTNVVEMVEGEGDYTETDFIVEASAAPVLETPLRGCVVNAGDTARLECKLSCEETLQITWIKDGATLSDTDRLKLSTEADSIFALIVSSAQKSDEGDYTITASSSGGTIQLTANIIVIEKDEDSEDESEEDVSEAEEDGEEDVEEGDDKSEEEKESEEESSEEGSDDNEEEEEECDHIISSEPLEDEMFIREKEAPASRLGGFFSQAVKIGEYLMRDYIM